MDEKISSHFDHYELINEEESSAQFLYMNSISS